MRTFIALELPSSLIDDIAALVRTLQESLEGRFMERYTYHLTLAFLGDIDEQTSHEVIAILNEICANRKPLTLACDGLGTFGRPQDCTLWLGITPNESLMDLANTIRNALKAHGIWFDPKPFKPHITLGRRIQLGSTDLSNVPFPAPTEADTVTFFKSILTKECASYKPLYSKTLKDPNFYPASASTDSSTTITTPILDVSDVIRLEKMIAADGTPLSSLMHSAGLAVADCVKNACPPPAKVCVLAGSGNNGGDGWVAAFDLARSGYETTLITPKDAASLTSEPAASTARTLLDQNPEGVPTLSLLVNPSPEEAKARIQEADMIVDGLLGTGFSDEEVREPYVSWITFANTATKSQYALAIDVPSGLNAQTGEAASPTFFADETVTMLALKTGLTTPMAAEYCGTITLAPLVDAAPYIEALVI